MSLILTVIIFYSPRISLTLSLFFWALLACIQISYAISLCTVCNVRVCSLHSLVEYQGNCRKRVMTLLPLVTRDPDLFSFKFEQGSGKLLSLQSASFQISQQAARSFESVRFLSMVYYLCFEQLINSSSILDRPTDVTRAF